MRRRSPSFLFLLTILAAVLVPRAAVFAQPAGDVECLSVTSDAVTQAVQASSVIAIARVASVQPGARATLVPEALLKGSAAQHDIVLEHPAREPQSGCTLAQLVDDSRILVFLAAKDGRPYWPSDHQVFLLEDGRAVQQGDTGWNEVDEAGLTSLVRGITGQYVVPAATSGEGASIDWTSTVIPVGLAILGLFAAGLVLMRIWHRIDPS